jgi:hypothetical protein
MFSNGSAFIHGQTRMGRPLERTVKAPKRRRAAEAKGLEFDLRKNPDHVNDKFKGGSNLFIENSSYTINRLIRPLHEVMVQQST